MGRLSCTDATDCTAVGSNGYRPNPVGCGEHQQEFLDSRSARNKLEGLSCVDATDCTAVGYDGADVTVPAAVLREKYRPAHATSDDTATGHGRPHADPAHSACTAASVVACTAAFDARPAGFDTARRHIAVIHGLTRLLARRF